VTLLCPALVRSAMSPTGVDPADVADEALQAMHQGRLAVVPAAWRASVLQRAENLVCGQPPTPPAPA
jgi:short-subunit dehydrogenase